QLSSLVCCCFFICDGIPRNLHSFPTRRSSDLEKGYKTLLVDLDPQANATTMIENTFNEFKEKDYDTLFEGLKNKDLRMSISRITDKFDFIPSSQNTTDINELLNENNKYIYLSNL